MVAFVGLAALTLLFAGPVAAQETADERYMRFQLFANCAPMKILIGVSAEAEGIGLGQASVRAAVESRLRSARLYDPDAFFVLGVTVDVARNVFNAKLQYTKHLYDYALEDFGFAVTWSATLFGSHGDNAEYIMNSVLTLMDKFLVEYLRVNEEACAKR